MKLKEIVFSAVSGLKNMPVWSNWLMALPLIGSAITLTPAYFVFTRLWATTPSIKFLKIDLSTLDEPSFFAAHLNAETFFFISQMLLAVTSVVTIILMAYVFTVYLRQMSKKSGKIVLGILSVVVITALIFASKGETRGFYDKIFEHVLKQIRFLECTYCYTSHQFVDRISSYADVINLLVVVGITLIVGGFSVALHTPKSKESILVKQLLSQRKKILLTLYSGAALLICGVIATYAFVRIPGVFLAESSVEHAYMTKVAMMITITFGIGFTLVLAGSYLPASAILSFRARNLAESLSQEDPEFETKDWLKEQNLNTSTLQNIIRAAAILAPFLVSLSQVIDVLS